MFDAIKGPTGLYPGQKQIRSQLRVIKANPQITRATNAVITTAGVAHVVADATIFPVARAAATIASEYIEETSTRSGVVGAAAYVCTIGMHGIVDVATKVQVTMQPDPNSVAVRGQRDQQCDTKIVEMFDYELDEIDQRTTIEQFGKKQSAGVSDDGLEDVDLYQGLTPTINGDTRNTVKCVLDPHNDWELVDPEDEINERFEDFHNERLVDSDGSLSYQQKTQSYYDGHIDRQYMDSYNERLCRSNSRLFAAPGEYERGRQLKRTGPSDFINSSRANIASFRRCNDKTSSTALPIHGDSTTSDEEGMAEVGRLVLESRWRAEESARAEKCEDVRQIGDILDNTAFQPSISFMQADPAATNSVPDEQLAAERAKYEFSEDIIISNMPEQVQEVKTSVHHSTTRTLRAPTVSRRDAVSGSSGDFVVTHLETRSQPIAIPGAIARMPVRNHTVKRPPAMDTISDNESVGSGAFDYEDVVTQDDCGANAMSFTATGDDSCATVFTFRTAGLPLTANKAGTGIAGRVSSVSFKHAAANSETACHHREWQLCACGKKEMHTHVREDEEGEFEV